MTWSGISYGISQRFIGLAPGPFGTLENFGRGVEGYFQTTGIVPGIGGPARVPDPLAVNAGPGFVTFSSSFFDPAQQQRVPNFEGSITFVGTGLTHAVTQVASGDALRVLTGGTVTGIVYRFNERLAAAVDAGITDELQLRALRQPEFLVLNAEIAVPNVAAASISAAVVQSYNSNSLAPLKTFLERDNLELIGGTLPGGDGVNILLGLDRGDRLVGGAANDALAGQGGNDTLDGGPGTDLMEGGPGSDFYLPGPPGPEAAQVGVGDTVTEGLFRFTPGDFDTVSYQNAPGPVVVDLNLQDGNQSAGWAFGARITGVERVIGSVFGDVLVGKVEPGGEADELVGGFGDDTLFGLDGGDTLSGGPGVDFLDGGPNAGALDPGGPDIAAFAAASSQIEVFFPGNPNLFVADLGGPPQGVWVAAPGGGIDRLVNIELLGLTDGAFQIGQFPNSGRGVLVGADGADVFTARGDGGLLFGRGGDDTLTGGAGGDVLDGGAGADRLDGGPGADAMTGGPGGDAYAVDDAGDTVTELALWDGVDAVTASVDFALGGAHVEVLRLAGGAVRATGNGLDNLLVGTAGDNLLEGGDGADTLEGGAGRDTLSGGAGDDVILVDDARDTVRGGAGIDLVRVTDTLRFEVAGTGVERVEAAPGAGRVWVLGDAGATAMTGNAADNILVSGGGADVMTGGGGADFFAFQRTDPAPAARVTDFDAADKLLLDDRFFGLGNGRVDLREISARDVQGLLRDGLAAFDFATRALSVDIDGPGGPLGLQVIATFEGRPALGADDVMLF